MPRWSPDVLLAATVALLAAACASPPPAAPDLQLTRSHRAETVGVDLDPAAALALTIEWRWVTAASDDDLVPVGSHASAVMGSAAFGATPLIASEVKVALGEPARGVASRLRALPPGVGTELEVQHDALPAGVTTVLANGPLSVELSREPGTGNVGLALVREGQVKLGSARGEETFEPGGLAGADESEEGELEPDPAEAARRRERETPVAWREVLPLDTRLEPGGPPAVIALTGGRSPAALVLVIEVQAAPQEPEALAAHSSLVAESLAAVAATAARDAERAVALDAAESKHRQLLAAARAMAREGDRRRSGVFLAAESGASLALDTLLVADDATLEALGVAWRQTYGEDMDALVRGDNLAWSLESTTARWLAKAAEGGELPAELEAVLLRQTGVVGRSPSLLTEYVEESDGLVAWRERIEQENRFALEDNLPAARVRAFDWLAARGLQPPNYDPLGSREERRAALLAADTSP